MLRDLEFLEKWMLDFINIVIIPGLMILIILYFLFLLPLEILNIIFK